MEFVDFKSIFQRHVYDLLKKHDILFKTDIDKDSLWNTYLDSFPEGTNQIFRERREHDCSVCRQFIKNFGNVVFIENNKLKSIWDFDIVDCKYKPVINALSNYVKSKNVRDVFITSEQSFGINKNFEKTDDGVYTWEHFYIKLPKKFITNKNDSNETIISKYRDNKNVFKRSLEELKEDSIQTVLELIYQNSLYKGEEWKSVLEKFLTIYKEYHSLNNDNEKDLFCWINSVKLGGVFSKIRNHSIGTLLTNISLNMDLNEAVRKYESIVAPSNYKRPKAIFTKKMIDNAQKKLQEMGLINSLGRRFATINDITVNNILFANKDTLQTITGNDVFSDLKKEATSKPKKFDKVEEVQIEKFIKDILPTATNIEIYPENKHSSNFVSLIAPADINSNLLFKWNNNFSWAYNGNITDSMKDRVKQFGGNVNGILRFSIQWNENGGDNKNDLDAHCVEPNKNHIWFENAKYKHKSTGMLDVDIIEPLDKVAVENITWTDLNKMNEGIYHFYVHNYTNRGGESGFAAEIEFNGEIYKFEYRKRMRQDEKITVAKIKLSKQNGIEFIESLPNAETVEKTIWNIKTNQFQPITVCMFSPNYWDEQKGIGNKHYFFMIKDCINDETPNGFFNEFLKEELNQHRKVFEALGSKMRVEPSNEQLSGLGFSSTKRNSLVCKIEGNTTRMIKLLF